jgi:hypothetical protein
MDQKIKRFEIETERGSLHFVEYDEVAHLRDLVEVLVSAQDWSVDQQRLHRHLLQHLQRLEQLKEKYNFFRI